MTTSTRSLSHDPSLDDALSEEARAALGAGDRLPLVVAPPPGPRSRALAEGLAAHEAPGVNTLAQGEPAVVWAAARGSNVFDVDGNVYLDLSSGFGAAAVGHAHPRVVAAVARQAGVLLHGLGDVAAHPERIRLAERLTALAPIADAQVHFAVSGADAVEIAIETAMLATARTGVLCFDAAYHGLSSTTRSLASRAAFREPFAPAERPGIRRLAFGCRGRELATFLDQHGDRLACAVVEPIAGREGIRLPPAGWIAELADRCRERGVLLIADEIFTGFGRTGGTFAVEHENTRPDLLCCGKALGGGLPLAAVLGRRETMAAWGTSGEALRTSTFLAHPLACAAANAVLDLFEHDGLGERALRLGETLAAGLDELAGRSPVTEVRGRGLLWGVELCRPEQAARAARGCLERGLIVLPCGPHGNTLELVPSLTITPRQLAAALDILKHVIDRIATEGRDS